jgi:hypothetical protein
MVTSPASFFYLQMIGISMEGNIVTSEGPRFSDRNLRHMASILVENHSLKPFKQRVLERISY